jgi:alginate O-acetyltransferase complex protein AlgI
MLFSSITFLYVFLPLTLLAVFAAPKRAQNAILLVASVIFYSFGEPVYIILLVISSVNDYVWSLLIEKFREHRAKTRLFLSASIIVNLSLLGFFKYADFLVTSLNALLKTSFSPPGVALPIGISFYTFQTMSYTIDVYRGDTRAERNFVGFAAYVTLFAQLIAGPIVRYVDVARQLKNRSRSLENIAVGARRFAVGLAKKVLLANAMGEVCREFLQGHDLSVLFCWLYAVAYTFQIYFDFSGYSDMAVGLGRMFGFFYPENFNYPYISQSITEFWRRWHMTLGQWFRDYLYIPLGGNRVSTLLWVRNIAAVWLLTGLWHGAAWNFVLWGGLYGFVLVAEKLWLGKILSALPRGIRHIYVMMIVILGFVIFNAASLPEAAAQLAGMFGLGGLPLVSFRAIYLLKSYFVLLCVCSFAALPAGKMLAQKLLQNKKPAALLDPVFVVILMAAATSGLVDGSFNPFLYFRF